MFAFKEVNFSLFCAAVVVILMATTVSTAGLDSSDLENIQEDLKSSKPGSIKNPKAKFATGVNDLPEVKSLDGKRHPKLGFNIPFPIPGLSPSTGTTIRPDGSGISGLPGDTQFDSGNNLGGASGLGLASTAVLIKSGVLGGLTAIKAAVIPPLFIGSIIIFLLAGAVFFTCNVLNCGLGSNSSGGGGGFGSGFGGLPSFNSLFNRNGYDYYEQQIQPVYQALEDGYKKFE